MPSEAAPAMSSDGDLTPDERVTRALDADAYRRGFVRLTGATLAGFTHLVATRQGLFAIAERGPVCDRTGDSPIPTPTPAFARIAWGSFFGMTMHEGAILVFEACDIAASRTRRGRIVRLALRGDAIVAATVIAHGLDNGCHGMDMVRGALIVTDTYNQRLLLFDVDTRHPDTEPHIVHPLPAATQDDWAGGYAHINTVLGLGDDILLLLHNGTSHGGRRSEVAVFDAAWRERERWTLPGGDCHGLALDAGEIVACGSAAGQIVARDRIVATLDPLLTGGPMMTRGLSIGADGIAVGASRFYARRHRHLAEGDIVFLDRDYAPRGTLHLPGAPTEIRRIDGRDHGLSDFLAGTGPGEPAA